MDFSYLLEHFLNVEWVKPLKYIQQFIINNIFTYTISYEIIQYDSASSKSYFNFWTDNLCVKVTISLHRTCIMCSF